MTHPLTDELIEQIAQFEPDLTDPLRLNRTHDMRSAFVLGVASVILDADDSDDDDQDGGILQPCYVTNQS